MPARSRNAGASSSITIAPAPITSTRPSCIGPNAARWARGIAISPSQTVSKPVYVDTKEVNGCRVIGRHVMGERSDRRHRAGPARPQYAPVPPVRRRSTSPSRSRTIAGRRHLGDRGGSEGRHRSVSRTQPMSAEKLAVTVSVPSTTLVDHRPGRRRRKPLLRSPIR